MSYTKQNWEDRDLGVGVNGTPVNAEHLNHMEDGIKDNSDEIESKAEQSDVEALKTEVSTKAEQSDVDKLSDDVAQINADLTDYTIYASSVDELIEKTSALPLYSPRNYFLDRAGVNEITGGALNVNGFGVIVRQNSTVIDFYFCTGSGRYFFAARYRSGEGITYLYQYEGTSYSVTSLKQDDIDALRACEEEENA